MINNLYYHSKDYKYNSTLTKYELHGGSLHCTKYAVNTSEDVGFEENFTTGITNFLSLLNSFIFPMYIGVYNV